MISNKTILESGYVYAPYVPLQTSYNSNNTSQLFNDFAPGDYICYDKKYGIIEECVCGIYKIFLIEESETIERSWIEIQGWRKVS